MLGRLRKERLRMKRLEIGEFGKGEVGKREVGKRKYLISGTKPPGFSIVVKLKLTTAVPLVIQ